MNINSICEAVGRALADNIAGVIIKENSLARRVPLCSHVRAYVLVCAAIAATGSMARGDWTHFRFDPAHHGVNPNETTLSPTNVANLTVKWRTDIGGGCFASASVVDGKLYTADTGGADGKLHALDIATGQELWTFPPDALTGDHAWTSPAAANGIVYFGVNRPIPVVYGVDAATGQEIWEHVGTVSNIVSSPALLDGRLYVAFTDGTIRALDATNGQVIWSVKQNHGALSSPAIADGRLYITLDNSGLLALNADTGATLWLSAMPGPQWSSPAVDNGRVFVGSRDDHKLYAFDAVTGATLWTATTSDWVQTSPAVDNGVVYIGNNAGNLYAFSAQSGALIWRTAFAPGFGGLSSPTVANGVVYIASALDSSARHFEGKLYALDAATGQVLFSDFVSENDEGESRWVNASPTVDDGVVYIPNYGDGTVAAFGLDTGGDDIVLQTRLKTQGNKHQVQLKWSPADGGDLNILRNGVVVATTPDDGKANNNLGTRTGEFTYQVCETDSGECSNEVTVVVP